MFGHKRDKFGLYNYLQIQSPVYFSLAKSIPVLNPAFYRAKATFYVQTFPTGFIEYGHPPNPPIDESTTRIHILKIIFTSLSSCQNVLDSIIKSIMKMDC